MLELHPLVIRLALDRSFSWDFGARTKNFGHLLIDTVRFPLRPADFDGELFGLMLIIKSNYKDQR